MAAEYTQFINRNLPRIERGCLSKAVFSSRREARSVANHFRHGDGQVKPYACDYCGGWHLGHPRRRHGHA